MTLPGLLVTSFLATALAASPCMAAEQLQAKMDETTANGPGKPIGTITVTMSDKGAEFALDVKDLPPGPHGFHVHANGACGPAAVNGAQVPAGAAGGHWDTAQTGKHEGPEGHGHIGDLPVLNVAANGTATQRLTAPHIRDLGALKGHALVIHAGGDNYSDSPAPLGGGGARLACGVLQ